LSSKSKVYNIQIVQFDFGKYRLLEDIVSKNKIKSRASKLIHESSFKCTFGNQCYGVGEWVVPTQEGWFKIKELARIKEIQF